MGDSYAANRTYQVTDNKHVDVGNNGASQVPAGLKPKDLIGMPWRLAFALQEDGWWLRSDIIWSKPNPMPESVTDRPTKAHEYLFMLTKREKYFYDAEAVREKAVYGEMRSKFRGDGVYVYGRSFDNSSGTKTSTAGMERPLCTHRNLRTVWTISTHPFPGAHFATFPPALVETCLKAGTSEQGCCVKCGAPWVRETKKTGERQTRWSASNSLAIVVGGTHRERTTQNVMTTTQNVMTTTGWRQTCRCDTSETVPCTVLDPFFGSGTTGIVADRLGRAWIGCELKPEYLEIFRTRMQADIDKRNAKPKQQRQPKVLAGQLELFS
jgi:hypothetical protein